MTDGEVSTVTGTPVAGSIAMIADGDEKRTNSPCAGGLAFGGDTNTNGNSGSGRTAVTRVPGAPENDLLVGWRRFTNRWRQRCGQLRLDDPIADMRPLQAWGRPTN